MSGGSQLQGCGPRLGNLHVRETARATASLEERYAKQPDVHDFFGGPADVRRVVRVDIPLIADPLAQISGASADHHVRFERRPAGNRTTEGLTDGQARAPEVSKILAVVKLGG